MFYEAHDPRFQRFVRSNAPVKRLATGFDRAKGPAWFGDAGCLLFSDIPNNRIMGWAPEGRTAYRQPSNYTNDHTRDRQGRLTSCQHGTRSVTRTEYDGTITTLADGYLGKRLNSPNDVVVKSDDSIWFTDPHYAIMSDCEGLKGEEELPCNVYRVDHDGTLLGSILIPEIVSNFCFGGRAKRQMFITATTSLYSVILNCKGAQWP